MSGIELLNREEQVQVTDHIVHLRHHRVLAIDHGERSGALLTEVHDRLGFELAHGSLHKWIIRNVADAEFDLFARSAHTTDPDGGESAQSV